MSAAYDTIETMSSGLRIFTLLTRASGTPIVGGTVNYHLKALTGANANKWWQPLSGAWVSVEVGAPMTHQSDGHWSRDPVLSGTSPFTDGVEFLEYYKESNSVHIPGMRALKAGYTPGANSLGRVDLGNILGSATHVLQLIDLLGSGYNSQTHLLSGVANLTAARLGYLDNLNIGMKVMPSGATVAATVATMPTISGVWGYTDRSLSQGPVMPSGATVAATVAGMPTISGIWGYVDRTLTAFGFSPDISPTASSYIAGRTLPSGEYAQLVTALSTTVWTNQRAANLERLSVQPMPSGETVAATVAGMPTISGVWGYTSRTLTDIPGSSYIESRTLPSGEYTHASVWTNARAALIDTLTSMPTISGIWGYVSRTLSQGPVMPSGATVTATVTGMPTISGIWGYTERTLTDIPGSSLIMSRTLPSGEYTHASVWTNSRATNLDRLSVQPMPSGETVTAAGMPTISGIWEYTSRTLTSFGTLASDVITPISGRIDNVATQVWNFGSRTLTSLGAAVSDIVTPLSGLILNVPSSVWVAASRTLTAFGFNVGIADGSISSGTFDNSTAFPLLSRDSGSTAVARRGNNTLTLAEVSGQITALALGTAAPPSSIAYEVWARTSANPVVGSYGELVNTIGGGTTTGGSNLITVTVKDGSNNPIENAKVRFHSANSADVGQLRTTNVSGIAYDQLDDGTWILTAMKTLYAGTPQTVVVDGDESVNYTLSAIVLPVPSSDLQTTAYAYTYNGSGLLESNVKATFRLLNSDGTPARGYQAGNIEGVSDASGLLTLTLLKNSTYQGTLQGTWQSPRVITFTTDDADSYAIPELIG
jgi:hypothetical protein